MPKIALDMAHYLQTGQPLNYRASADLVRRESSALRDGAAGLGHPEVSIC